MDQVPDSVVGFLLNNLTDLIKYNVKLIEEVDEKAEELLNDIDELKSFVQYCSEKKKGTDDDQYMEKLINTIRDTIYDSEDTIEDYIVSAARPFKFKDIFTRKTLIKDMFKRRSIGKLLEEIRPKVNKIYERQKKDAMEHIKIEHMVVNSDPPNKQVHIYYVCLSFSDLNLLYIYIDILSLVRFTSIYSIINLNKINFKPSRWSSTSST